MAFLATASLTSFGSALSGQSVRRAPSSATLATRQPVAVIECKCRRNLKREKQLRNRKRTNELRRMKAAKSGNYGGFQRRTYNEPEGAANSADYINPFHYDERGEPIGAASEAETAN